MHVCTCLHFVSPDAGAGGSSAKKPSPLETSSGGREEEEGGGGGGGGGGSRPPLRVVIPGQKDFVPRTVSFCTYIVLLKIMHTCASQVVRGHNTSFITHLFT